MKQFCNETTCLYNFNDFHAKFEYLEKVHPNGFSNIHYVIRFYPSYH